MPEQLEKTFLNSPEVTKYTDAIMEEKEIHFIQRLRKGDNDAYKQIFDHHYVLLCKVAYEFVKDDFLAKTITDDVIFHLWEIRENLEITTSMRSYLVRAVRNRCINYLNLEREKREVRLPLSGEQSGYLNPVFISDDYPMTTLLEKELEHEIQNAINKLPEECRNVFKKSRFEDKRYEEISEELGISINTVKYHMKNAIVRLSNDLRDYLCLLISGLWIFK